MANLEVFRFKSAEQLTQQVSDVSNILGESITQSTIHNESLGLSINDLKVRFPVRYQAYIDILRKNRKGEVTHAPYTKRIHTLNVLDGYISTHHSQREDDRTLFAPQMNAFEALRAFLEEGRTKGYIKLPTGSGKTVVFTEFVEATDLKTLIVVPTQILVNQTEEKFREFAPATEIGKVYSRHKDYSKQTTVSTYASFLKDVESGKINPDDYDLLILDEAHKSLSSRKIDAVRSFSNAIKLGFTATPRYTQEKHLRNLLSTEIHTMSIREAVEQGILSSLSIYIAKTDIDLSEVKVTSRGEYQDRDLERAINIMSRNTAAVNLYEAMFQDQPAVAYCVSVKHAEDLASRFREKGISAEVISGYQPREEQFEVLNRFRSGFIKVLCNADILIEGFDDPHVNVCLNLRPTISPVIAEQRAGRVLRPDPGNPFKHAYIIDFIDQFTNPNHFPVSFAQILEAAHIFRNYDNPDTHPGFGIQDKGVVRYPELGISGLRVITNAEEVMRVVSKMVEQKYQLPHEGWNTINAVALRFKISRTATQRLTNNYRESHPEYFRMFQPPHGNMPHEYISPELVSIIQEVKANAKVPIEGWMTATAFAKELGVSYVLVGRLLERHREADSINLRVFRAHNGQLLEHYSPGLLNALRTQIKEGHLDIGAAAIGWLTYSKAGDILGADNKTIETFAEAYKETSPELFVRFRINKGRGEARVHIAPELVQLIKEKIESIPLAEEGWVTREGLMRTLAIGHSAIVTLLEKYKEPNPGYFQIRRDSRGRVFEYISPALIPVLQSDRRGFTPPQVGWLSYPMLAQELGVTHPTAKKIAQKYQETYPEDFKSFLSSNGRLREFVSPRFIAILKEEIGRVGKPEEGWITAYGLQSETGIDARLVYNFVKKYRDTNLEYFRVYRDRRNRISEHFSPELMDKVKKHYGK